MIVAKVSVNETTRCLMVYTFCGMATLVLMLSLGQLLALWLSLVAFEDGLMQLERPDDVLMLKVASIDALSACVITLFSVVVLWSQLYINQRSVSVGRLLSVVNILGVFLFLMELDTFIFLFRINNSQMKTHGFKRTMHKYGEEQAHKELMDRIQIDYQCCGNTNFKDWLDVPWVNGEKVAREIPFSCCKRAKASLCNHRDVLFNYQQVKGDHDLSNLTIYTRGCHKVFLEIYSHKVFYFVSLPILGKCFLLVVMAILLRYIITSIQSFMKNPDPKLSNEAYILAAFEPAEEKEIDVGVVNNVTAKNKSLKV